MPVHLYPWHARYGHTHLHTNVNTRTRTCVRMCTHTRLHRHTQAQEHSITSKTMPDKKRSKWQGPFYQWLFVLTNTNRSSELHFLFVRQPITLFTILQWSLYLHQIKGVLVWFGLVCFLRQGLVRDVLFGPGCLLLPPPPLEKRQVSACPLLCWLLQMLSVLTRVHLSQRADNCPSQCSQN